MPRLGRAVARTAVVAGTATAVSGRVASRQEDERMEKEAAQAAATPAPAAEPAVDPVAEIERLGALKEKGLLSDEEFAAAKAKLLGI